MNEAMTRTAQFLRRLTTFLVCVSTFFVATPNVVAEQTNERILVMGVIESNRSDLAKTSYPMAEYVKERMSDLGIADVVVVAAQDREQMRQLIQHGRVDWVSQTAYNASYFMQHSSVSILNRAWRGGSPTYRSMFFVKADSDITDLQGIDQKSIAFEHPYSTSAYFVPRIELELAGKSCALLPSVTAQSEAGKTGYLFSRSEYNTALWVDKGLVDVGVLSSTHWADNNIIPENMRKKFRVIHESGEVVRALELVRTDLDADIKQRLGEILSEIHADTDAVEVRRAYHDTQRFDAVTEVDRERVTSFSELMKVIANSSNSVVNRSAVTINDPLVADNPKGTR